jgi:hypothetical protein
MAAVDGADTSGLVALTADQVAARIAANVALRWDPDCAIVQQAGSTVTVTYNDCTGPRGLVHVSGELALSVEVSSTGVIEVHGSATAFRVNGATLEIDTDATYAVSGSERTLTVHTAGAGTGARGNTVEHEGDYTITWDSASLCGSIVGTWSTELGTRSRSNQVDVSRCAGGCPTGSIVHEFRTGASVTVTFDGTPTASWSASTGAGGTFALACR